MAKTHERSANAKASVLRIKEIARKKMHETSDPDEIRHHARSIELATELRPQRYTAPNKGTQAKTRKKIEFVQSILAGTDEKSRQILANLIAAHPDCDEHFRSYEAIYRFLGRPEFL